VTQGWVKYSEGDLEGRHRAGESYDFSLLIREGKAAVFKVTYKHVEGIICRVASTLGPEAGGVFWQKTSLLPENGSVTHYLLGWKYDDVKYWVMYVQLLVYSETTTRVTYTVHRIDYDVEGKVIGYDEERQFPVQPASLGWIEFPEGGEFTLTNHTPLGSAIEVYLEATRSTPGGQATVFATKVKIGPGERARIGIPKGIAGYFWVTITNKEPGPDGIAGFLEVSWKRFEAPPKPPEKPPEAPPPEEPELPESPWDALKDLLRRVLRDEEPVKIDPVITKALIGVMFTIFVHTIANLSDFVALYGLIPALLFAEWHRLITHMWLHASWEHYLFNALYLYVFGDNVEERLGYLRYLLFYLTAGIVAGLGWAAYALVVPGLADVPAVGASGAISGVMGAYVVLFPHANVVFLRKRVPAQVFLALWFLSQFAIAFQLTMVAWMAHVVGFVFGVAVGYLVRSLEREVSVVE
jgi:membrane associated rhomboid family serine protease